METQAVQTEYDSDYPSGNGSGNGDGADAAARRECAPEEDAARLSAVLESLLFAAGAPITLQRLVAALDGPDRKEILAALEHLGGRLERDGRGVRLVRVAGGYQLRTPPEHGPWIRRLLGGRPPRLSRPMLETLAVVAYRQPCTKIEVEAVRGVDADAVLTTLIERRLVRIEGRKEAPGRPLLYGTTREFLEVFGLPDLSALPPLRDLGEGAAALLMQTESESPDAGDDSSSEAATDGGAESPPERPEGGDD